MVSLFENSLTEVLTAFNPWWELKEVPKELLKKFKRDGYYEVMDFLNQKDLRRSIILTGLRRVGKTTILYQLIDNLLKRGIPAEKIIYLSFDHPLLKEAGLNEILKTYHEQIYNETDVFYIFDEIQYIRDWDKWIKVIYDQQPETQLIATGSASPALIKGEFESGFGRSITIKIPTLSFYEYCNLIGIKQLEITKEISLSLLFESNSYEIIKLNHELKKVLNSFNNYLQAGGFPETITINNDLNSYRLLREDIINKVIYSDLPQLYKIRNIRDLERVFLYLNEVSSNIISYNTIAKELNGLSRQTVENYINYLEQANLINLSWPINLDGKKVLKAQPKVYITDNSIRNSLTMKNPKHLTNEEIGKMIETTIFNHLKSLNYQKPISIGYYRNSKSGKEIDIIIETNFNKYDLIEVKYRENSKIPKTDAIIQESNKANKVIVITKNSEDFKIENYNDKKILYIPAYAFLYLLGKAESNGINFFI